MTELARTTILGETVVAYLGEAGNLVLECEDQRAPVPIADAQAFGRMLVTAVDLALLSGARPEAL